jgi:hypothetical protein
VRRLFPDASKDPGLAAEFRRLTEDELRRTKRDRLHALWESLIRLPFEPGATELELVVRPEQASDLAATLTDIRLILADRLDLETDEDVTLLYDELADADTLAALDDELDQTLAGHLGNGADTSVGNGAETSVGDDELGDPAESDPAIELEVRAVRASLGTVYIALTWMQESLVEVMTAELGD